MKSLDPSYDRERSFLASGVSAGLRYHPYLAQPLYVREAEGPYLIGEDGRRHLHLNMANGSVILEHKHPIQAALTTGVTAVTETATHVWVTEILCRIIPCGEQVRFAASGTEANRTALRPACHMTGRSIIVLFAGHYHGFAEPFLSVHHYAMKRATISYIPPTVADLSQSSRISLLVPPWSDAQVFDTALDRYPEQIADEVLSGFRMAPGGGQAYFHVTSDLCTPGKAPANGFNIAAICGRKDLTEQLSPPGPVAQCGSYAGHFISSSAAEVTLMALSRPRVYHRLQDCSLTFYQVIQDIFNRYAILAHVERLGARFGVYFGRRDSLPIRNRQYAVLRNLHPDSQIEAPMNGQFQANLCYQQETRILLLSNQPPLLLPDSFGHTAFRIAALCVRGIA